MDFFLGERILLKRYPLYLYGQHTRWHAENANSMGPIKKLLSFPTSARVLLVSIVNMEFRGVNWAGPRPDTLFNVSWYGPACCQGQPGPTRSLGGPCWVRVSGLWHDTARPKSSVVVVSCCAMAPGPQHKPGPILFSNYFIEVCAFFLFQEM